MGVTAPRRRSTGRRIVLGLAAGPAGLVLLLGLVVLLAGGTAQQVQEQCGTGVAPLPGKFTGPGSLGGVAGTGLTTAQVTTVQTGSPYSGSRITSGRFESTGYGPPWTGINGSGQATAGGIILSGGAPRYYMAAVDPTVISLGALFYAWPNPFGWRGPFLAADTGPGVQGRHIDFYDWRGRITQLRWGRRDTEISPKPIKPGGPDVADISAPLGGGCGTVVATGPLGQRIGQIARSHLGAGPSIPGFEPPVVSFWWCAWFAANVWRKAGVPIPISAFSGYPYTWAEAKGLLFKRLGQPPRSTTPPAGAALMYGTGPQDTNTSLHINLVDQVFKDGSFMLTGGNQGAPDGGYAVTREGPCRLSHTDPAYLSGSNCDGRPIYGIALPGKAI